MALKEGEKGVVLKVGEKGVALKVGKKTASHHVPVSVFVYLHEVLVSLLVGAGHDDLAVLRDLERQPGHLVRILDDYIR